MSLKERIQENVKEAMRSRDKKRLETLRMLTAAIKQVEVDERIQVDEPRLLTILDKLIKQRKESISQFQAAGRDDLLAQEQFELELLSQYLPEPLSTQAIEALINETLNNLGAEKMADMGKVMAKLKPLLLGRADLASVSALVKAKLS